MIERAVNSGDGMPPLVLINLLSKIIDDRTDLANVHPVLRQKASRMILLTLGVEDGITQNDIVRSTYMKGSTISVALDGLEKEGIVVRKKDEYDRRIIRVYLTERGYEINKERRALIDSVQQMALSDLSAKDVKDLGIFLTMILKNLT